MSEKRDQNAQAELPRYKIPRRHAPAMVPARGADGEPAAAANAAKGAGSRPGSDKSRKRKAEPPRGKGANALEPVPEVDPYGPAEPAALPGEDAVSEQDPETGIESGGAQPEVGRAGAPAAAAAAATGAGSRPGSGKARKRARRQHVNALEPVPEVL